MNKKSPVAAGKQSLLRRAMGEIRHAITPYFFLSYPKSGRTWLRYMIGLYYMRKHGFTVEDPSDLSALRGGSSRVPRIIVTHEQAPYRKVAADLPADKSRFRGKGVLLMVRDPRDVVVSLHAHLTSRRGETLPPLEEFLFNEWGGIPTFVRYLNIWAEQAGTPKSFSVIAYEDLLSDCAHHLRQVLTALGEDRVDEAALAYAVENGAFDKMKVLEESGALGGKRFGQTVAGDPASGKLRQGKAGGFRKAVSPQVQQQVDDYLAQNLNPRYARYIPGSKAPSVAPSIGKDPALART